MSGRYFGQDALYLANAWAPEDGGNQKNIPQNQADIYCRYLFARLWV
jgi:hypothetical protein